MPATTFKVFNPDFDISQKNNFWFPGDEACWNFCAATMTCEVRWPVREQWECHRLRSLQQVSVWPALSRLDWSDRVTPNTRLAGTSSLQTTWKGWSGHVVVLVVAGGWWQILHQNKVLAIKSNLTFIIILSDLLRYKVITEENTLEIHDE